jgi:AcrR family transcriptional regulator
MTQCMARRPVPADQNPLRRVVLRAAAQVFSEQTPSQTSVEDLLKAANLSRRTFYRLYPNLDAVLEGLYADASHVLIDAIKAGLSRGSTLASKRAGCIDAYLTLNARDGRLMRMLEIEALRIDSSLASLRLQVLEIIAEAMRRALAPNADMLLAHGVVLAIEGVMRRGTEGGPIAPADEARMRAAMLQVLSVLNAAPQKGDEHERLDRRSARPARRRI